MKYNWIEVNEQFEKLQEEKFRGFYNSCGNVKETRSQDRVR